ncbi:pyrroline-5-carboxylate reductase [Brachybacterium muris]|uniref:pyrroline-5-carboxylate reductase family protein n=1 Tax=Brachybacterium muris TaxID=219301 RepID=UPI001EF932D6|nr:NAD(P)-binding domain-containing protein [Brachybacterium muris]MBM7501709.1 pyrroline-5-carboxylate reductase [Brachybacterium muris]
MTPSAASKPDTTTVEVTVIGAGNMGGPVAKACLASGLPGDALTIVNSSQESSERAAKELGGRAGERDQAVSGADVVVLGVKPYQIVDLAGEIAEQLKDKAIVISLAAGITLEAIEKALPDGQAVVRAMPEYSPRWGPLIEGSGATSLP